MKTKNRYTRIALGTLMILSAMLGVYVANRTYQFEIFVKGILGFVVLYLWYFFIRYSKIDTSMDGMLSDPKIYKYPIFAMIGAVIAYWAMGCIFDMISLLLKTRLGF